MRNGLQPAAAKVPFTKVETAIQTMASGTPRMSSTSTTGRLGTKGRSLITASPAKQELVRTMRHLDLGKMGAAVQEMHFGTVADPP